VDSCLRGNIGAEVEAIVKEMGFQLSFLAPAFPEMGRVTVHDVHLIHDTLVAETELARDPVTPVRESRLSRLIAGQTQYRVGQVDVQFLEDDDEAMAEEIARLVKAGVRHVAFDATSRAHLEKISRFALKKPKEILLVGSAGLAGSLSAHFERQNAIKEEEVPSFGGLHHLLVSGTTSEHTRLQLSTLAETYPYHVLFLPPHRLADRASRGELSANVALAQHLLAEKDLIITTAYSEKDEAQSTRSSLPRKSGQIVEGLGWFVASLLEGTAPASLFLSGGDTANAVLRAMGAKGIRLLKEVLPGVALGTLMGTLMNGLPVVTKAGAFGDKGTLVTLHEYWLKKRGRTPDGT
jgi:uncharacterized protein YgbK (DUF1537 family)